uniref:DinB/UmuC family translesion DNA polymerase n=1 Tax=Microbacterium sp. LB16 TaxID=3081271 RepID=UPI003FA528F0
HGLGSGEGPRVVDDTPWDARSHSRETTYQENVTAPEQVEAAIAELAAQAFDDCAAEGRPVVRVHLKVRYAPFETKTIGRKLAHPTTESEVFVAAAVALGESLDATREVRLLGVRAEMTMPDDADGSERTPVRGRI